jgi:hypothetical protein
MTTLEDEVRRLVRDELRALGVSARVETYTPERLPPGFTSREAFGAECRRLRLDPALYRPGREWGVPADVWREARAARRSAAAETPDASRADAALARSRLRLSR